MLFMIPDLINPLQLSSKLSKLAPKLPYLHWKTRLPDEVAEHND